MHCMSSGCKGTVIFAQGPNKYVYLDRRDIPTKERQQGAAEAPPEESSGRGKAAKAQLKSSKKERVQHRGGVEGEVTGEGSAAVEGAQEWGGYEYNDWIENQEEGGAGEAGGEAEASQALDKEAHAEAGAAAAAQQQEEEAAAQHAQQAALSLLDDQLLQVSAGRALVFSGSLSQATLPRFMHATA